MRGSSRSRSLSDEGDVTDIGRHPTPHRHRRQVGQRRATAKAQSKKIVKAMTKWLTMCWGGGNSSHKLVYEKAREKELLLLEDSDDEVMVGEKMEEEVPVVRKKAAYVPQHAASSFLRTATPRRMRRANEVV